jgi:hypothetical protein
MKITTGILLLVFGLTLTSAAQWTTSGSNIFNSNTGNVGIGTSSPTVKLEINGGGTTDVFNLLNESTSLGISARVASNTDFHASAYTGRRSRGSLNSPTDVIAGDRLTGFYSSMFVNGAFRNSAAIQFYAGSSPSSSSFPVNIRFETTANSSTVRVERMRITESGDVGIGTSLTNNPNSYKLAVNGKIGAKEVQVENTSSTWADYVFESTYDLMPIEEVEAFVKANKHLPEIPSAEEIKMNGHKLGEMDVLLLKKVEELTLYLIELKKQNLELSRRIDEIDSAKK